MEKADSETGCVTHEETNSSLSNDNRLEAPKAPGESSDDNDSPTTTSPERPSLAATRPARPTLADTRPKRRNMRESMRHMAQEIHMPQNLGRWPRTFACCFGVLFPLMCLVMISLLSGMVLGKLEMQGEVDSNDAFIRSEIADETYSNDLARVLKQLPTLCLALLHKGEGIQKVSDILEASMTNRTILDAYIKLGEEAQNQTSIPRNKTVLELSTFMSACGDEGAEFREIWSKRFERLVEDEAALSFNYIRCVNRSRPFTFNLIVKPSQEDMYEALPSTQAELYEASWRKNQKELEEEYLSSNGYKTQADALTQSYKDATGREKCTINVPSAAWFWFTVMTTVGYGNQVPSTTGGRTLTYTLGFISILVFGGTLATVGNITTYLVNDAVHRLKRQVSKPLMVFIWGSCWALWMVLMSWQAVSFQTKRLDEPFSMRDAYWFSFISTTTVGFGDYYLDPEGLFVSDLLSLWGAFLIGFVLLSSFLTELSQLLGSVLPDLAENLRKELKYVDEKNPEEWHSRGAQNLNINLDDEEEVTESHGGWSHPILRNNSQSTNPVRRAQPARSNSPSRSSPSPKRSRAIKSRPNDPLRLSSVSEGQEDMPPPLRKITPPPNKTDDLPPPLANMPETAPPKEKPPRGQTPEPEIIEFSEYVDDSEFDDGQIIEEVVGVRPRGFKVNPREVGIGVPQNY